MVSDLMKRRLIITFILCSFIGLSGHAQVDTSGYRISLLTCESGPAVYSTFGHSAIRVKTSVKDWVFDYGVFDFDTPGFLWRFLRGSLDYELGVRPYDDFLESYIEEQRGVKEEVFALSFEQADQVFQQLRDSYRPENRYYRYDFFFDNCSTRIHSLLDSLPVQTPIRPDILGLSFREHLQHYIHNQPWITLGTDLLLGPRADQQMDDQEQLFLPHQLSRQLGAYTILQESKDLPLLLPAQSILTGKRASGKGFTIGPLLVFSILVALGIGLVLRYPKLSRRLLSGTLLGYGLIGAFFLFMWLGTSHTVTAHNWNLWWANPLYLIALFFRNSPYRKSLLAVILFWNIFLLLLWWGIPQDLPTAIIPLVVWMIFLTQQSYQKTLQ